MSVQETDTQAAEHEKAPRISHKDIEAEISHVAYMMGDQFLKHANFRDSRDKSAHVQGASAFTICLVILKNGWLVLGKSAPVSPDNYNLKLGEKAAYEDCLRQIWPLMGYQLKEQLHTSA